MFLLSSPDLLLVGQYLATRIMHIKIHLVSKTKLFHKFPQLLKSIEKSYTPSSIEIIWLDQPHIASSIHLIINCEFSWYLVLILRLMLLILICYDTCIDFFDLRVKIFISVCFDLDFFETVVIFTKFVNFSDEVLRRKI